MPLSLSDSLDEEILNQNIAVFEYAFSGCIHAAYCNFGRPAIALNKEIQSTYVRNALKAHELGHHFTCPGDLSHAALSTRKKSEVLASRWALTRIMPIEKLVSAYQAGVRSEGELSDYLEISYAAIENGIQTYLQIYGNELRHGIYTITLDPFNVFPSDH